MFGRRKRMERRLRERGRLAAATIIDARSAGDGRWGLRLRVTPEGAPAFMATADAILPAGAIPAIGSRVDVLHVPGGGTRVVLAGAPSTAATPPETPAPSTPSEPEPDALQVLGDVLRHLRDGSVLAGGPPPAVPDGAPGAAPPADTGPTTDMSVAQLATLASHDPDGAGDEIMRRIEAGETTATVLVGAARGLDPAGRAGALAALRSLHQRGAIDDTRLALVQMLLG